MSTEITEWAYLAPGVRWLLRPCTTALAERVNRRVAAMIVATGKGDLAEFVGLGCTLADLPAFHAAIAARGAALLDFSYYAGAVWYAEALLVAWEGAIYRETGEDAPVGPEGIRRALRFSWSGRDMIILWPFLHWIQPPKQPIAADLPMLAAFARSHVAALGGGGAIPAALEELADLRTLSARCAVDAALQPGSWGRAGAAGPIAGADYDRCLHANPAIAEADGGGFVRCLRAIEEGALAAQVKH
ncbi:MAG: hypothetical protein ACHP7N_00315 [Caulobacterales bacterium]